MNRSTQWLVNLQLLHEDEDQEHPLEDRERRIQRTRLEDRQKRRPRRDEEHFDRHEQDEGAP